MLKTILHRLLGSLLVLFMVTILAFSLIRLGGGDPARLVAGDSATEEEVQQYREKMGLDKPYIVQYYTYIKGLLQGDLGWSWRYGCSVNELLADRLPKTAQLTGFAILVSVCVAIPLGVIAGIKKGSFADFLAMFVAVLGQSLSPVWIGVLVILVFAVKLKVLPSQGFGSFAHIILPGATLGFGFTAKTTRLMRSGMVDIQDEDYITAARARGVSELKVNCKYALRNAIIPVVTQIGTQVGVLMAGSMVIENIFAWPGMGQLMIQAINLRDYQLIQSILLVSAIIFTTCNLLADIIYTLIDPRMTFN